MKKPTKAQRHAIYKKALEKLDYQMEELGQHPFLCIIIEIAMGYNKQDFPELLKQRPKTAGHTWWPSNPKGDAARRRALLRCIKMSAPVKRTP